MRERLFQLGEWWLGEHPRSPKIYRYRYDPNIRQVVGASTGTADLEEAKLILADFVVKNARLVKEEPSAVGVVTVMLRYYDQHAKSIASAEFARIAIKKWEAFWDDTTVDQLTVPRQREFIQWLRDAGFSNGYIRRIVGVGKSALNWAWHEQEIASVPYIKMPRGGKAYDYRPSMDELRRFMAEAKKTDHLYTYCMIRLGTMCRGDAAIELTPAQVDDFNKLVRLNPEDREQTKKRRPIVPLIPTLDRYLLGHMPAKMDEPFVQWNGAPVQSMRTAFKKAAKRAGCSPRFVGKTLRHAAATELRARGVPAWEVSGMLGHTGDGGSKTSEVYAIYDPKYLSNAKRELESWVKEIVDDDQ